MRLRRFVCSVEPFPRGADGGLSRATAQVKAKRLGRRPCLR
jgi:hypothetical protein